MHNMKTLSKNYIMEIEENAPVEFVELANRRLEAEVLKEDFVIKDNLDYLLWLRGILNGQRNLYDKKRKEKVSILRAMIGADLVEKGINIGSYEVLNQTIELLDQKIESLRNSFKEPSSA